MVKRFPEAKGRNSKNRAPSTGRLPPTPRPKAANMPQTLRNSCQPCLSRFNKGEIGAYPIQVGLPPTEIPKMPQMRSVILNARRRPTKSEAIPQKDAPMHRPTNSDAVVKRTWVVDTPNSAVSDGNVRATPYIRQSESMLSFRGVQKRGGKYLQPETRSRVSNCIQT
jgi:hypothetical protein